MMACRYKYYKHREKAINFPEKAMSVILDAIEKRKLGLVKLVPHTSKGELCNQFQQSLYLAKVGSLIFEFALAHLGR